MNIKDVFLSDGIAISVILQVVIFWMDYWSMRPHNSKKTVAKLKESKCWNWLRYVPILMLIKVDWKLNFTNEDVIKQVFYLNVTLPLK